MLEAGMIHYIHIAGNTLLTSPSPVFRRAVEVVRDELMNDPLALQALALHVRKIHGDMLNEHVNQKGMLGAASWAEYSRKIYALETRVLPLLEYMQNPALDKTHGWRERLLQGKPMPRLDPDFEMNMDAEACVMLGDLWLDLSGWRAKRPYYPAPKMPPEPSMTLRRRVYEAWGRFEAWRQEMGDRWP